MVQCRVRGPTNDADQVVAAVQWVLASAHKGHAWPEKMLDSGRRQVIPGDGKYFYWALSAVEGKGGQAVADKVHRALKEGDMVQPPE